MSPRAAEYHDRKERGVCVECPEVPERGNVRCDVCLARRAVHKSAARRSIRALRRREQDHHAEHWRAVEEARAPG